MTWRKRVVRAGAALLACGVLAAAGERTAGDVRLECESLNACGASFSSAGGVELGWTIGQHGLHGDGANGDRKFGLQSGIWTEAETGFRGTVFLFQ